MARINDRLFSKLVKLFLPGIRVHLTYDSIFSVKIMPVIPGARVSGTRLLPLRPQNSRRECVSEGYSC